MSLMHLISDYENCAKELQFAIENDSLDNVKLLDLSIQSNFEKIFSLKPSTEEERMNLIKFLLNQFIGDFENSTHNMRLTNRILDLAAQQFVN